MRKTLRYSCQIIAVGQMMARLQRAIVHGAEHAAIARASEADRLHGSELTANPLRRNVESLEKAAQGRVKIGYQSRAQLRAGSSIVSRQRSLVAMANSERPKRTI